MTKETGGSSITIPTTPCTTIIDDPAISYEQRRAALDDMPNIVGTDENGSLGRSKDRLLRWYLHYYSTIRTLLQAPSVDREVVDDVRTAYDEADKILRSLEFLGEGEYRLSTRDADILAHYFRTIYREALSKLRRGG